MKTLKVEDFWWEDNNLFVATDEGTWKLENPYPVSVDFGILDNHSTEDVTIDLTMRYSDKEYNVQNNL